MTTRGYAGSGLVLLLALTGCSNGPVLTFGNVERVTEGAPRIHQGDTVTIGSMHGCLDKPGSVTITSIAPVGATGLKVTGWAVRPNPSWKPPPAGPTTMIGVEPTTLARLQFPTSREVNVECGKDGEGFEFAVQVKKTTDGEAGASGWVITYTSAGDTKTNTFPLAIKLCNEDKAWAKPCEALKV